MILWSGPVFEHSGYGRASRDYVLGLIRRGEDISVLPKRYFFKDVTDIIDPDEVALIRPHVLDHAYKPVDIFINHITPDISFTYPIANKNVIYTVWETDRVPDFFIKRLQPFDKILTASQFSKEAFTRTDDSIRDRITVVPHIIHDLSELSIKCDNILKRIPKDTFVFMTNMEWHRGKGYDILIPAFIDTFRDIDDVILILKTYHLSSIIDKGPEIAYIKKQKKGLKYPMILPISGHIRQYYLYSLYKRSDCFVLPSRREAFGLCFAEALGFRKIIIAPDKGGHTEFLDDHNAVLCKSVLKDIDYVEIERSLYKGQKWVETDYKDLCDKMMYVYKNRDKIKDDLDYGINETLNKYSEDNIIQKLLENITW